MNAASTDYTKEPSFSQNTPSEAPRTESLFSSATFTTPPMSTIILAGCGVAAAAFAARVGIRSLQRYKGAAGGSKFYKGGFEPKMNRREAVLILQMRYVVLLEDTGKPS